MTTDRFCIRQRRHFSDQLDGARIPLLRRLLVRLHLAICPPCIRYQRSLEATRVALKALRDEDPPP